MIRNFLFRLFLVVLPVGIMVGMVNYKIDPANIFSTNVYVKGIAEILSAGHNVDNISNYDERLLQEQMVARLSFVPDVVVLGSSRVMQVGADFYPGKKMLNCGVSHANIKDVIAVVGLLDSMKKMPAEILLNLDPGLICKLPTSEWESLDVYYNYFINRQFNKQNSSSFAIQYGTRKKVSTLFSFQYFQSSILFLGKGRSKNYTDVGRRIPSLYGRLSDGTVSYAYDYTHPDTTLIAEKAAAEGKNTGFEEADTAQVQLLERLLDYFHSKNIKVTLCMLGYHPAFYKAVNEYHKQRFIAYEAYFKDLATRKKLPVTGSFDPSLYNRGVASFYDDSHSSIESIRRILIQ